MKDMFNSVLLIFVGICIVGIITSIIVSNYQKKPLHSGVIVNKKEVLDGSTHKSTINYQTRKRFTIKWDIGVTTDLFPTDNDYYTLNISDRTSYRILLTDKERDDYYFFDKLGVGFLIGIFVVCIIGLTINLDVI